MEDKQMINEVLNRQMKNLERQYQEIRLEEKREWSIMKEINQYYAKLFNDKYNFIGWLYQGRYKSELIENDAYNLQTSRLSPSKTNKSKKRT